MGSRRTRTAVSVIVIKAPDATAGSIARQLANRRFATSGARNPSRRIRITEGVALPLTASSAWKSASSVQIVWLFILAYWMMAVSLLVLSPISCKCTASQPAARRSGAVERGKP